MTNTLEKTEHKEGYKKTKFGWIPEEWEVVKLGDCFTLASGITKPNDLSDFIIKDKNIPVYGGNGVIGYSSELLLNNELIVIGRVGEKCGCVYHIKGKSWITDNALYTNKFLKDIYLEYFSYLLTKIDLNRLRNKGGQPLISQKPIYGVNIALPPLSEQQKIAEVLTSWDNAIEKTEKLIEFRQKSKKAFMQNLLTGKLRFPEFSGQKWQKLKSKEVFKSFSKKNNGNEELLSATQEFGVIPRSMLDGRVTMPDGSTEGYKLVEKGDFVISLRSFQGGIEYSEYRGIVSPAYTILKNIIPIDKQYYRYWFKSSEFIARLSVAVIGIRDGKQISFEDFGAMPIYYPSIEEQQKIASVLNSCDREIEILKQKLSKLNEQKKGLMQKLLTGQVRVKLNKEAG